MQTLNPARKTSIYPGVWHDPKRDVWRTRIRRNGKRSWSKSYPATDAGELKAALAYRQRMNVIKEELCAAESRNQPS
jgi:hypothetical protein